MTVGREQTKERTVHMIAPLSAPERRTRLKKLADVLLEAGYRVSFTGWERLPGEANPPTEREGTGRGIARKIILRGGGYGGTKTLLFYPLWAIAVFFRVLTLPRNATVFCLGFETAAPALLASVPARRRIVFDDADRFSMSFQFPGAVRRLLGRLERMASGAATIHLVPGLERYGWRNERMMVLRNTPTTKDFAAAGAIDLCAELGIPPAGPAFTVYANGWIGETRGAPVLLQTLEMLERRGLSARLLLMGRGDGASYERLLDRDDVYAFSEMPQPYALAGYAVSDLLFTFYDPKIPINRLAASNKWGDAIYLSTPFVVNSEVETAKPFLEAGAAFAVPYADVESLARLIEELAREPARMACAKKALRAFGEDYIPFDGRVREIAMLLTSCR